MAALRVIEATERWALGEIERCLLVVWRLQPTEQNMEVRAKALHELTAKYGGQCALVELVEPTSKPPNEATRRVAMEVFRDLGAALNLIAFTLEGDQLKATVSRAIITTMLFFVKQPQTTKVFRAQDEMFGWVKTKLGLQDPEFVRDARVAIESLRSQIGTPQPALSV